MKGTKTKTLLLFGRVKTFAVLSIGGDRIDAASSGDPMPEGRRMSLLAGKPSVFLMHPQTTERIGSWPSFDSRDCW
uniref:Uncharacterized protein n=1 Tax=Desulfatirhabdium butyrativorans TaxID=340467 RepID=A0A7C4ML18_9BACT